MSDPAGVPVILKWSFGTNATEATVAVGADGSVVSTYVAYTSGDYYLYATYGLIYELGSNPPLHLFGTDNRFDEGDAPTSIAIDPNGLAVSIHETNGLGDELYINIGNANGGQGSLGGGTSTHVYGVCPSIIAVGPGQFLISAISKMGWLPGSQYQVLLWQLNVSYDNAWHTSVVPVPTDVTAIMAVNAVDGSNPSQLIAANQSTGPATLSYANGVLAIGNVIVSGGFGYTLGTFNSGTFTALTTFGRATSYPGEVPTYSALSNQAIVLGPNNTFYLLEITGEPQANTLAYTTGTYQTGDTWTTSLGPTNTDLCGGLYNLPGNYPWGVAAAYTQVLGMDGLILAIASYNQCIDIWYLPPA